MQYIYNVWVNWFEGEENGYNVFESFEWLKEDFIENLNRVFIVKVSHELLNYLENDISKIPESLLEYVYQKSSDTKNRAFDYCFIATDGKKCLAIDTLGYDIPIKKSRLVPKQERAVLTRAKNIEMFKCHFDNTQKQHHILSLAPRYMWGLTRKEKGLKELLFMAIDQLFDSKPDKNELLYWHVELTPHLYHELKNMNVDEIKTSFINHAKNAWSDNHNALCEKLTKKEDYFQMLYEMTV